MNLRVFLCCLGALVPCACTDPAPAADSTNVDASGDIPESSTGESSTGGDDDQSSSDDGVPPGGTWGGTPPSGDPCASDTDCTAGEVCFDLGVLGGVCGDCRSEADCEDGGCSWPSLFTDPPLGPRCNLGGLGQNCDTDAGCGEGLRCAELYHIGGFPPTSTCSLCASDVDCGAEETCSPILESELLGHHECVAIGSLAPGEPCALDGSGDEACSTGTCAPVAIQGLVEIGFCGECESDADCSAPNVCQPGEADVSGASVPSACVPI